MAELRHSTSIPISAHSSDIPAAAELGAPDALVLGIAGCGGIGPTLRFAAACARAGVEFRFYSGDLGIATAAQLHVAAVLESVTGPHQTLLRWYHDDVIRGGSLRPHRGRVPVPDATQVWAWSSTSTRFIAVSHGLRPTANTTTTPDRRCRGSSRSSE